MHIAMLHGHKDVFTLLADVYGMFFFYLSFSYYFICNKYINSIINCLPYYEIFSLLLDSVKM